MHGDLDRYVAARRRSARTSAAGEGTRGNDLVALLLKKRLFSSPAAFASTLAAHAASVAAANEDGEGDLPDWYDDAMGWDDALVDDVNGSEAERELMTRIVAAEGTPDDDQSDLLSRLTAWTERYAEPADSKAPHWSNDCATPAWARAGPGTTNG